MSFRISPTIYKGPIKMTFDASSTYELLTPFFVGLDADAGYFAFLPDEDTTSYNVYTISAYISYSLKVDGNYMLRMADTINDKPWFLGARMQLYWTPTYNWVYISQSFFPGYVPQEYLDDDGDYQGDEFYSSLSIPDTSSTFLRALDGRGTLLNESTVPSLILRFYWPRWCKTTDTSSPYGEYTGVSGSGAAGEKVLGIPEWVDGNSTRYARSLEKNVHGYYDYGDVWYDYTNEVWLIGKFGDETGWWEGDEPSASGTTFTFTVPDGSSVTGDNIVLTYNGYGIGERKTSVYMAEIGIYR